MDGDITRRRTTVGSLAILGLLVLAGAGLPWIDQQIPGRQRWNTGVSYRVGRGIEMVPPPGAFLDVGFSRPGKTMAQARFVVDAGHQVTYTIWVSPHSGSLGEAAARMQRRLGRLGQVRLRADETGMRTSEGTAGRTGSFTLHQDDLDGRYVVLVLEGASAVEAVVIGSASALEATAATIDETFASLALRGAR